MSFCGLRVCCSHHGLSGAGSLRFPRAGPEGTRGLARLTHSGGTSPPTLGPQAVQGVSLYGNGQAPSPRAGCPPDRGWGGSPVAGPDGEPAHLYTVFSRWRSSKPQRISAA